MKWIGQNIQDFISRFREDVYLESVTNAGADTDKFLVIDANNKVAFRTGAQTLSDGMGTVPLALTNISSLDLPSGGITLGAGSGNASIGGIQATVSGSPSPRLMIGSKGSVQILLDTDQGQAASDATFSILDGGGTVISVSYTHLTLPTTPYV